MQSIIMKFLCFLEDYTVKTIDYCHTLYCSVVRTLREPVHGVSGILKVFLLSMSILVLIIAILLSL